MPHDPMSYLNLWIWLGFSVQNFSLESICLRLQRNLVWSEGNEWRTTLEHREPAVKQAWTSQNCVGCVRELSNYSRTHGSFYPHCCFLAPPTKVNSKPWSSSCVFLMCFLHLSTTLKWFIFLTVLLFNRGHCDLGFYLFACLGFLYCWLLSFILINMDLLVLNSYVIFFYLEDAESYM